MLFGSAFGASRVRGLWRCFAGCTLALLLSGSSCLNPCEQLADKICSCQSSENQRLACKRETKLQQDQRTLSNADRLGCQEFLRTCECRAIAEGRLEACGLARE